jgi:hypothetical protein
MGRTRNRKTKRQSTPEWQAFQARLIHGDQIEYEIVRPTLTLGQPIKDRATEVGLSPATLTSESPGILSGQYSYTQPFSAAGNIQT